MGIDDKFLKQLAVNVKPGTSVLLVLVRHVTVDKVLEQLKGTRGEILKTSLTHEDEAKFQAALSSAKQ